MSSREEPYNSDPDVACLGKRPSVVRCVVSSSDIIAEVLINRNVSEVGFPPTGLTLTGIRANYLKRSMLKLEK